MYKPIPITDVSKLHNEINLYINQSLTVTTAAITLFGIVAGLMAPITTVTPLGSETQIRSVSLVIPTVLMVIFSVMLRYCQSIFQQIHIISTYLVETESSDWEYHHQHFIDAPKGERSLRSSASKLPLYVFAALGIFTVILSAVTYAVAYSDYCTKLNTLTVFGMHFTTCGVSLTTFVVASFIYLGFFIDFSCKNDFRAYRQKARRRWRKVLNAQAEENLSSMRTTARLSESTFAAVWDNADDDIYNDL